MTDGDLIGVPDLPSLMRFSTLGKGGFDRTLADVEAEYIRNVLASVNGDRTPAAEILGHRLKKRCARSSREAVSGEILSTGLISLAQTQEAYTVSLSLNDLAHQ
jgi:hypothetical protein